MPGLATESIPETWPARWWETQPDGKVHCYLCPRHCRIGEGQSGFCFIRRNDGGSLVTLGYGRLAAVNIDPIEKKPLNHFLPGTSILSLGGAGCNMGSMFCQNWSISKAKDDHVRAAVLSPAQVVRTAGQYGCPSLAYTYNEPTIWGEFIIDTARLAREAGLANVMVTNGYITPEALWDVYEHIDAANIDLKAFTDDFYRRVTLSKLDPVLQTIETLCRSGRVWVELTTLLIPNHNDSDEEIRKLSDWVLEHVGPEVPLHFTAYHPDYKLTKDPPTPPATLRRAREIALGRGLHFVYLGNVHDREGSTTWCPGCGAPLIVRDWHSILAARLVDGCCAKCGRRIPGRFPARRH
ncbi:AmmeMemoRadiSam system radical SAM enzyme [bacterium]|nr:AmmeMemoRadiSam system radical SAM enzyme [bacterium]